MNMLCTCCQFRSVFCNKHPCFYVVFAMYQFWRILGGNATEKVMPFSRSQYWKCHSIWIHWLIIETRDVFTTFPVSLSLLSISNIVDIVTFPCVDPRPGYIFAWEDYDDNIIFKETFYLLGCISLLASC